MNKTAIKNFAVWARRKLISEITYKAGLLGVTEKGAAEPLPQSTKDLQFFDIGTKTYAEVQGAEIAQRNALVAAIRDKAREVDYKTAFQNVVEEVAYTWFNRMIAIRFMEINDYLPSRVRVLSSENPGKLEPDFVTNPFDTDLDFTPYERDRVLQFKDENKLDELFRALFIKQCNKLHEILPELFEATRDYTELLLTISFTDKDGVVYHLTHDIPESDFDISHTDEDGKTPGQVEIIGWMYQYYNTEPKDEVFALLKKNVKITKERIPAATQLFTPDWIVRYMVENSLGRLWVEGHPNAALKAGWKYYLEEAEQEPDVQAQLAKLREDYARLNPEDIKVIDPCMGSGHILVYAFDVLMQIYEAQGYTQRDAARLIVEKNLYGLDIDKRAYQLAYFAVMMKARQYNRRILNGELRPHLYAIQDSNGINRNQLQFFGWSMGDVERNKALTQVEYLLDTFRDAKEYGSILSVDMLDWELLYRFAGTVDYSDQISLDELNLEATKDALWTLVEQGAVLAQKYDVVVTNPPYMAVSNAGAKVNDYVKKNFPDSKADLFAVFIERCGQMAKKNGYQAMITQHAWMFLSSFEKLRRKLLAVDIVNMAHLGARAFEEIGGEVVQTTSFVMQKANAAGRKGLYARLVDGASQQEKEMIFLERKCQFVTDKENYDVIPGKIIAYWLSDALVNDFRRGTPLGEIAFPRQGLATSNNDKYLRLWFEVANDNLNTKAVSTSDAKKSGKRWYPHCKGGGYRKWYGNRDYVIDWKDDGKFLRNDNKAVIRNPDYYFLDGFSYSDVSTGDYALRYYGNGFIFDSTGPMIFLSGNNHMDYDNAKLLALMNTSVVNKILTFLCPTIHYTQSAVAKIPLFEISTPCETALKNVELSRDDWDAYENSWDFKRNPLV